MVFNYQITIAGFMQNPISIATACIPAIKGHVRTGCAVSIIALTLTFSSPLPAQETPEEVQPLTDIVLPYPFIDGVVTTDAKEEDSENKDTSETVKITTGPERFEDKATQENKAIENVATAAPVTRVSSRFIPIPMPKPEVPDIPMPIAGATHSEQKDVGIAVAETTSNEEHRTPSVTPATNEEFVDLSEKVSFDTKTFEELETLQEEVMAANAIVADEMKDKAEKNIETDDTKTAPLPTIPELSTEEPEDITIAQAEVETTTVEPNAPVQVQKMLAAEVPTNIEPEEQTSAVAAKPNGDIDISDVNISSNTPAVKKEQKKEDESFLSFLPSWMRPSEDHETVQDVLPPPPPPPPHVEISDDAMDIALPDIPQAIEEAAAPSVDNTVEEKITSEQSDVGPWKEVVSLQLDEALKSEGEDQESTNSSANKKAEDDVFSIELSPEKPVALPSLPDIETNARAEADIEAPKTEAILKDQIEDKRETDTPEPLHDVLSELETVLQEEPSGEELSEQIVSDEPPVTSQSEEHSIVTVVAEATDKPVVHSDNIDTSAPDNELDLPEEVPAEIVLSEISDSAKNEMKNAEDKLENTLDEIAEALPELATSSEEASTKGKITGDDNAAVVDSIPAAEPELVLSPPTEETPETADSHSPVMDIELDDANEISPSSPSKPSSSFASFLGGLKEKITSPFVDDQAKPAAKEKLSPLHTPDNNADISLQQPLQDTPLQREMGTPSIIEDDDVEAIIIPKELPETLDADDVPIDAQAPMLEAPMAELPPSSEEESIILLESAQEKPPEDTDTSGKVISILPPLSQLKEEVAAKREPATIPTEQQTPRHSEGHTKTPEPKVIVLPKVQQPKTEKEPEEARTDINQWINSLDNQENMETAGNSPTSLDPESKAVLAHIPSGIASGEPTSPRDPIVIDRAQQTAGNIPEGEFSPNAPIGIAIYAEPYEAPVQEKLEQAYNALVSGQAESAIAIYKQILADTPDQALALFGIATAYHKNQQRAQAREYYIRLLEAHPTHQAGLNNFLVLIGEEAPTEALKELKKLLQKNPEFSPIQAQIASIYSEQGEYVEAARYLSRAVALSPENLSYRYNLAIQYDRMGQYQRAAKLYQQLVDAAFDGKNIPGSLSNIQKRLTFIRSK